MNYQIMSIHTHQNSNKSTKPSAVFCMYINAEYCKYGTKKHRACITENIQQYTKQVKEVRTLAPILNYYARVRIPTRAYPPGWLTCYHFV